MVVEFYQNSGEKNVVDKTSFLSLSIRLEGVLRDSTSILNPEIEFEIDAVTSTLILGNNEQLYVETDTPENLVALITGALLEANYCYIPAFKRWFFITDITATNYSLWVVSMRVDTLMSFKEDILELNCLINRQENNWDANIVDDKIPLSSVKDILEYEPEDVTLRTGEVAYTKFTGYENANGKYRFVVGAVRDNSYTFVPFGQSTNLDSNVLPNVDIGSSANLYALKVFVTDDIGTLMDIIYRDDSQASKIMGVTIYPFNIPHGSTKYRVTSYSATTLEMYPAYMNGIIAIKHAKFIINPIYNNFWIMMLSLLSISMFLIMGGLAFLLTQFMVKKYKSLTFVASLIILLLFILLMKLMVV